MPPPGTRKEEVNVMNRTDLVDLKWGCDMIKTVFREVGLAVVGFWEDLSWAGPKEGPLPKPGTLRIHPRALAVGMGRQRW